MRKPSSPPPPTQIELIVRRHTELFRWDLFGFSPTHILTSPHGARFTSQLSLLNHFSVTSKFKYVLISHISALDLLHFQAKEKKNVPLMFVPRVFVVRITSSQGKESKRHCFVSDVISYMEKVFFVSSPSNQVDNGTFMQQQLLLVSKSTSLPNNSTIVDGSHPDSALNASENSLSRTLSHEALEDESLQLLSSLDISGQNLQRTAIASANDHQGIQPEGSISTADLRLKLHLYKFNKKSYSTAEIDPRTHGMSRLYPGLYVCIEIMNIVDEMNLLLGQV